MRHLVQIKKNRMHYDNPTSLLKSKHSFKTDESMENDQILHTVKMS